MIERDDSTYHDHEYDHTPEEVANDLPAGHGSHLYTEEELDAIEYWESLRGNSSEEMDDMDDDLEGHRIIDVPPRLPEDGDLGSLPKINIEEFERLAGVSGAGPTDCLNPGCGKEDGKTRAGGTHCHDCTEDLACL